MVKDHPERISFGAPNKVINIHLNSITAHSSFHGKLVLQLNKIEFYSKFAHLKNYEIWTPFTGEERQSFYSMSI